jgi:hypothetical protein
MDMGGSGEEHRLRLEVPRWLPEDTIVCLERKDVQKKGEFCVKNKPGTKGLPITPDMEPLDDEAIEISRKLEHLWVHPIDTLPSHGGSMIPDSFRVPHETTPLQNPTLRRA